MRHFEVSLHVRPFWWRLDFYRANDNRLLYAYFGPFAVKVWLP